MNTVLIASVIFLVNAFFLAVAYQLPQSIQEDNIYENVQVLCLFISMVIFLYAAVSRDFKSVAFISAVTCFLFILRELNVESFDIPHIFILLFSGTGKKILFAFLILLSLYFLKNSYGIKHIIKSFIPDMNPFIISLGILFVISWVFDKKIFDIQYNLLFEELAETNAYFIIIAAAMFFNMKYTLDKGDR